MRLVVCEEHGPTSKADCLNRLWKALCQDEILESKTYGAVILHDAEDIVHPEALKLFGHLTGRASLVQIPVIPRRALKSRWIAGHYGDEFAELHAKQMVLREALGVSLPSAGVGCAFARSALARISIQTRGKPFDAASMTEDYELGLKLTGAGARGIFARLKDRQGQLVATQEFFPDNLEDAVRQKARWMAGIALTLVPGMLWPALLGFALIGLGCANLVPVLFSLAAASRDMPAGMAVAAVTTTGYAGILLGPALIGFAADATSLAMAFGGLALLTAAFPLAAARASRP